MLETQVEDEDTDREQEEDVCDEEYGEDDGTRSVNEAINARRREGVGGGKVRLKQVVT